MTLTIAREEGARPDGGLLAAFLHRASTDPDRSLFTLHSRAKAPLRLSHRDLLGEARRWSALFAARGVAPGDVVFVSLAASADLFGAFLGAVLIGAAPALLPYPTAKQDPALFWGSHEALFRHTGAALLVTFPANAEAVGRELPPGLIPVAIPGERPASACGPERAHGAAPDDVVCLQHSSGTTGLKKGVALTLRAVESQVASYAAALGLAPDEPLVSWLPFYHDMGFVTCLLMPLLTGCPAHILDPFEWLLDPLALFDVAAAEGARYAWLPNFAFQHLVNAAADDRRRVDLSGVKAFVNCSEPCRAGTVRAFAERFASWGVRPGQVAACYAMAEATFAVTQTPVGEAPKPLALDRRRLEEEGRAEPPLAGREATEVLSVGRPIPGCTVSVRGPDGTALPEDLVGDVAVSGEGLFAGYHRSPERSARVLRDGVYRTGDLGFLHGGELHVLGRADDLIIVLGRNVLAHDVEALVGEVAGVKPGRAVAFGLARPELGSEDLVIVAELARPDADAAAVRRAVRGRIESTIGIVPARIVLVGGGWLVKTTSGKISRTGNRDKYLAGEARAA